LEQTQRSGSVPPLLLSVSSFSGRFGAFEVQVATRLQCCAPKGGMGKDQERDGWEDSIEVATVFSKLASGCWPAEDEVSSRILQALSNWG
ncbi:unnamed protein product, partial [Choristocarpus tenellus]